MSITWVSMYRLERLLTPLTRADTCMGCAADHVDLSEGAMKKIDANYVNDGIIPVTFELN